MAGSKHIAQREIASFARSRWAGDVVGIVAHNAGREVPRGGRGQLLVGGEHHRCGRFAEVQSGAVGIEGAAGRIAQRFEGLKARHDESRLHIATADHRVAPTAAFQQARSHHKCRDTRDAGVGNDHGRAAVVQLGRDDFGRRAEAHALPRQVGAEGGVEQLDIAFGRREHQQSVVAVEADGGVGEGFADGHQGQLFEPCEGIGDGIGESRRKPLLHLILLKEC